MSDGVMLRPGIAMGSYPELEEQRSNFLDDNVARLVGWLRQRAPHRARHDDFIASVTIEGERLSSIENLDVRQEAKTLKHDLFTRGLEENLVVRAFALIRQVAEQHLKLRPYDVQILAGRVMLQGRIAEMDTGEGKTLTATLPACTAAMAGIPVHIVTVNDFLVKRDAKWMSPIYTSLGLTVGMITEDMSPAERKQAYACDVTYCTNKQLVFDYLKDQIILGQDRHRLQLDLESLYQQQTRRSKTIMRGLCFAIVDEADSVLIDEARTPLIISNRSDNNQEELAYKQAIDIAGKLTQPRDFFIRQREKKIILTDFGRSNTRSLARPLGGIWRGRTAREDLVQQALMALHLYERDKDYLVQNGKIQIIDEYTGRVMPDRSWERGLHQMIEANEGLNLTTRHETLARISYQRFFRRYLRLAGMTGTAQEVTGELWSVYRASVQRIPTNRALRRTSERDQLFVTPDEKWRAVVQRVSELHKQGRPVLIGTRSVAASELISSRLNAVLLPHQVLNASQNQTESKVIADAGQKGHITVATNMAGRGTDIKLGQGVSDLGGLHVLATERHEAKRIDRQLFGRCGRQGDAGSYQVMVSLEDELIVDAFGDKLKKLVGHLFPRRKRVPNWLAVLAIGWAQTSAERHHRQLRGDLLRLDEKLGDLLAFSGRSE